MAHGSKLFVVNPSPQSVPEFLANIGTKISWSPSPSISPLATSCANGPMFPPTSSLNQILAGSVELLSSSLPLLLNSNVLPPKKSSMPSPFKSATNPLVGDVLLLQFVPIKQNDSSCNIKCPLPSLINVKILLSGL